MRIHGRAALPGYEQETLAAAPEGDSAMSMVIECWRDLEGERPLGFGCVGFIPFRALKAWAEDEGLDRELFQMLKTIIHKLDGDRMERDAAKRALKDGARG
jgi:hypothetical protein